ncbi:hypothetical protein ZOSMA_68G00100 [Zostera marina]|uniref:Uncharacterized protein n=1 Tax=Zostera marina TaxID=29655 RepID=A0A0K9NRK9_ZOSMR|nr:hypothetical protein ZOSMA_68G00100 [Zostera marina]
MAFRGKLGILLRGNLKEHNGSSTVCRLPSILRKPSNVFGGGISQGNVMPLYLPMLRACSTSGIPKKSEVSTGFTRHPIVCGSVFSEWCKAVASDTFRMAVNEAEARMKSKAGVIGRSEDGELGMKLDSGYISPHFITDQKTHKCELENPLILIHEKKLFSTDAIEKLLQLASNKQRSLLIVAEDIGSDALGSLILNKLSFGVQVCAIKAPGLGDNRKSSLQNLASISGAEIITQEHDIDNLEQDIFGTSKKVIICKADTFIVEGAGATKITKEKSAEERDIEMAKSHLDESELLLKHLLKEEENLEIRQSERLNFAFKNFIKQFPVRRRRRSRKLKLKS